MNLTGTLVFSSGRAGDYDLWTLSLHTGELRQLTRGECANDEPRWSPDGRSIAFISNRTGVPEIWVIGADGDGERQVTRDGRFHASPAWTPDGRSIISCSNVGHPDEVDIFRFDIEGAAAPQLLFHSSGVEMDVTVSPRGDVLLYSSPASGNYDIWEYDLTTKKHRQLTRDLAVSHSPSYSPDGTMVAYVSSRDPHDPMHDKDPDIWVMSREGTGRRRVRHGSGVETHVAWSPDGRYLVFTEHEGTQDSARIRIAQVSDGAILPFDYARGPLEREIGAVTTSGGILTHSLPAAVRRRFFDRAYFGGERHPQWRAA